MRGNKARLLRTRCGRFTNPTVAIHIPDKADGVVHIGELAATAGVAALPADVARQNAGILHGSDGALKMIISTAHVAAHGDGVLLLVHISLLLMVSGYTTTHSGAAAAEEREEEDAQDDFCFCCFYRCCRSLGWCEAWWVLATHTLLSQG